VLVAAQAILGAQMPMIFTIAGLAGQSLAKPVLGNLADFGHRDRLDADGHAAVGADAALWAQAGFVVGAIGGGLGGRSGPLAVSANFPLFVLGGLFTGIYMSAQGFYRFAAADTASEAFRPKAISWVMAGGLLLSCHRVRSLVKVTADAMVVPFMGTYLAVIALNLWACSCSWLFDIPTPKPRPPVPRRAAAGWNC
jgi:hypothetical protein